LQWQHVSWWQALLSFVTVKSYRNLGCFGTHEKEKKWFTFLSYFKFDKNKIKKSFRKSELVFPLLFLLLSPFFIFFFRLKTQLYQLIDNMFQHSYKSDDGKEA
jgi:hypothetical protein